MLLPTVLRKRVHIHYGDNAENDRKELEEFGIPMSALPTKVGGSYQMDMDEWIEKRKKIEAEGPRF